MIRQPMPSEPARASEIIVSI
uniref:Uncharacterized protein n=1 Tax=Anguilla anguilla TaxID=7936 RepID=A0A0E9QMB0_ANGAN